jgi:hypothetical protein
MANNYTNAEIADMHFMYGNSRESHHLCQKWFLSYRIPERSIFSRILQGV